MESNLTFGENGETAFKSTGDKNLDLFGTVNRGVDVGTLVPKFISAWNENPEYAIKVLLNFRDIKKGKGEKLIARIMFFMVKITFPDVYEKLLPMFIELGCWKDLLFLYEMGVSYGLESQIEITAFAKQLSDERFSPNPSLCAKWAPTEGCHFDKKTGMAKKIMAEMESITKIKIKPKNYRNMLTDMRRKIKIIETQLSQERTSEINFSAIPSRAHMLYSTAFLRGANANGDKKPDRVELMERYNKYQEALKLGKEKANFKGIMPHELIKNLFSNGQNSELIESQWKSLREEIEGISVFDRCVSIVDVSGSMSGQPMDVAIALGILVSECSKGPFKDKMFTFSEHPTLSDLSKITSLYDKAVHVQKLDWGGSTNIEAVFEKILDAGLRMQVSQQQMPDRLFIFTDMQFNEVNTCYAPGKQHVKTFDKIAQRFAKYGYTLPQIVCWNLRNVEAVSFTKDDENICMLSGFSTPILKAFLKCKEITPSIIFLSVIGDYKLPDLILKPMTMDSIDISKLETAVKKCDFKSVKKTPQVETETRYTVKDTQ
jgi:hypothetical protein